MEYKLCNLRRLPLEQSLTRQNVLSEHFFSQISRTGLFSGKVGKVGFKAEQINWLTGAIPFGREQWL